MKIAYLVGTLLVGSVATTVAQDSGRPASGPKFDVVSIKRLAPGTGGSSQTMSPDTYYRAPVRALELISEAFKTQRVRIFGAPGWASTLEYEIKAKIPPNSPASDVPLMLRDLLMERFGLQVHTEQRNVRFFALSTMTPEKLGPKMRRTAVDCEAIEAERKRSGKSAPLIRSTPVEQPVCTRFIIQRRAASGDTLLRYNASGITMAQLADWLVTFVGAPVVDRTGLVGRFDVDVEHVSQRSAVPDASTSDAPSAFAAVQDQLGLRLDSVRGALDVIIVDGLHEPSEN